MSARTWDKDQALNDLAPILWRYVAQSAQLTSRRQSPENTWLSTENLRRLAACHLSARAHRDRLLTAAAELIRRMPATADRHLETLQGQVSGRIDWTRTFRSRVANSDPTLFVCEAIDRRYDTDLGRFIKGCLVSLAQLSSLSGFSTTRRWPEESLGSVITEVSHGAASLVLDAKLRPVRHVDLGTLRNIPQLTERYSTEVEPLANFLHTFVRVFRNAAGPPPLEDIVGNEIFNPRANSTIFELQVVLQMARALEYQGYTLVEPVALLPDGKAPVFVMQKNQDLLKLWWQRNAWGVLDLDPSAGRWNTALSENQLRYVPLRPDILLKSERTKRLLVVEVKLTEADDGFTPERDALRDLLAYDADLSDHWQGKIQYLAVAWNATGRPISTQNRFIIADLAQVGEIVGGLTHAWNANSGSKSS